MIKIIKKSEILALENRNKIYSYISKHPGIHLSELFRRLDISEGTIRYHLLYLERKELITKKKNNGCSQFFTSKSKHKHSEILKHIRNPVRRNILVYILIVSLASQKDIAKTLNKSNSTINHHLKKLKKNNIIEKVEIKNGKAKLNYRLVNIIDYELRGRKVIYQLVDGITVYETFITYKDSLFDDGLVDTLLSFLISVVPSILENPEYRHDEKTVYDRAEKILKELVPIPICC